jgi:pantoate--beta-alanine ligase
MILFKHSKDLVTFLKSIRKKANTIGFVPTMGALHKGHLSLIKRSKATNNITVASIFVNPVQFNNKEDFVKYPSTIDNDVLLLEENGCDILFMPSEKEIYPDEISKQKHFELGHVEKILEGKFRPGHFQGVCLVVEKLLAIIEPDNLYLGQKDYQQCLVIKKLITLIKKDITVTICPIVRETSGLAMSSRNLRLNDEEKRLASSLNKTLETIKDGLSNENLSELKHIAISNLENKGFRTEYLELANRDDLAIIKDYKKGETYILLIAAWLNDIRLIDNLYC